MEFAPTLATALDEADRFEHEQVLRNGLTREPDPVLHHEPPADFEECLVVSLAQFIQDRSSRRSRKRFKDVYHGRTIGKSTLAW